MTDDTLQSQLYPHGLRVKLIPLKTRYIKSTLCRDNFNKHAEIFSLKRTPFINALWLPIYLEVDMFYKSVIEVRLQLTFIFISQNLDKAIHYNSVEHKIMYYNPLICQTVKRTHIRLAFTHKKKMFYIIISDTLHYFHILLIFCLQQVSLYATGGRYLQVIQKSQLNNLFQKSK